ncbi:MAG: FUSC family protein [Pseudomonadota bacterium]
MAEAQTTQVEPDASTGSRLGLSDKSKFAIKTALSLMLAYLIPMSQGWPQPQTAAITVMVIAAAGLAAESLQKGVMRVIGTVAGAIIGLTLIAVFPQDRMVYLVSASIVVSVIAYLYSAYQGDSTLFMLTAVVTLMVFNGGDADGAFQYGIDRAFMTAFGVIIYTVVASTLWPVRAVDNTRALARSAIGSYARAFHVLHNDNARVDDAVTNAIAQLVDDEAAFNSNFKTVRRYSDAITAYQREWDCIVACHEQLQSLLLPALRQDMPGKEELATYIQNYDAIVERIDLLFSKLQSESTEAFSAQSLAPIELQINSEPLRAAPHLVLASVLARAQLLRKLQTVLLELHSARDSILNASGDFSSTLRPSRSPSFIWWDVENAKTALRMFITFWLATALWIWVNPALGFTFVALSAVLVLMVSYTPATPTLLIILFTLGFAFALPAYVFLLPQMTHWLELAAFMFAYAFIGYFIFQGPVSLFYMLGLFILTIQNTMSYHVDFLLLAVVNLYMLCSLLIITTHFPFSSKPEKLYPILCKRFFRYSALALEAPLRNRGFTGRASATSLGVVNNKLQAWGSKIAKRDFPEAMAGNISQLSNACELLHSQLTVLQHRSHEFAENRLIERAYQAGRPTLLPTLSRSLAHGGDEARARFDEIERAMSSVDEQLATLRDENVLEQYERREIGDFFVYLNLQHAILVSLQRCFKAQEEIDWDELQRARF